MKSGHLDLRLVDSSGLASLECATKGRPKSDLFEYKIRVSECESAQRQSPETVRDQPHFGLGPDLPVNVHNRTLNEPAVQTQNDSSFMWTIKDFTKIATCGAGTCMRREEGARAHLLVFYTSPHFFCLSTCDVHTQLPG